MGRHADDSFNLADLFERVAEAVPDRLAMVAGARRLTYGELDDRANRLAAALSQDGIGPGTHVGLQLYNGTEYIEGMLAAFKLRAVPINVNYRYVENELRYLFNDADLAALVVHASFVPRVVAVSGEVPSLRSFIVVGDGTEATGLAGAVDYEAALKAASPPSQWPLRSSDDIYCVYTGGTTGMPKGVLWRHEDIFFAAMGGGDMFQSGNFVKTPAELVERLPPTGMVALPIPPFMHASAHWLAFHQLFCGGTIVVVEGGRFDPAATWDLVERERVNTLVIVGDAMARPLADALAAQPDRWDASSLIAIGSGGAILSSSTKEQLTTLLPGRLIVDAFGSSETGQLGSKAAMAGVAAEGARFTVNEQTAVLDENLQRVEPGSGAVGRLARSGYVPLGYYNDPEKTAAMFVEAEGKRWVLPGDMATVDGDGTLVLLGRGSVSINTGGEKVFPEEVEAALKAHPSVLDAVVVGVPDERWGERVVGLVQSRGGEVIDTPSLQDHCRALIAGYKLPREIVVVDTIVRSPAGKADYRWAKEHALAALPSASSSEGDT